MAAQLCYSLNQVFRTEVCTVMPILIVHKQTMYTPVTSFQVYPYFVKNHSAPNCIIYRTLLGEKPMFIRKAVYRKRRPWWVQMRTRSKHVQ